MPDIVTIGGSPSTPSRSSAILEHIRSLAEGQGFTTQAIQVRALPAEALLWGRADDAGIQLAIQTVTDARVVIIATPVYKAAYTGLLKTFLDVLPQRILEGKIVFPIATGGSSSHLLALDYALKPVLSSLGAQHILSGLYVTDSQFEYANGIQLELGLENRLGETLKLLFNQLATPEYVAISGK